MTNNRPSHKTIQKHFEQCRKKLEQTRKALQECENKLETVFEGSHDAIVLTTKEGLVLDCNKRAVVMFGLENKAGFYTRRLVEFSSPLQADGRKSLDAADQFIERAFREGPVRFEWLCQRNDGKTFPAEVVLSSIQLESQSSLLCVIRDISGRKKTGEALRRRNIYLEALNETAFGLMRRMELNDLFKAIVGRAVELTGADEGWLCLFDPGEGEVEFKAVIGPNKRLLGSRFKPERGLHGEILRKRGTVLIEDYRSWPERAPLEAYDSRHTTIGLPLIHEGHFEGTLGLSYHDRRRRFDQDIIAILERLSELASIALDNNRLYERMNLELAERKRAAEESQRLQEQLLEARKMESIGRLAGGVAHDFNNMLQVILGHVEIGSSNVNPSHPVYKDLTEIGKAAERSADLTRQLLAFARRQTAAPKVLDLNGTVSGMLEMLRRLIGEDINLVWKPGSNLWQIKVDPFQLDQILVNLSANARDAISGIGTMTIETANIVLDRDSCAETGFTPGDYVLMAVSDDGSGMDEETLDHVFEPFFTTKEIGKGTGLGLPTVYGIVRQNEGFVNITSQPGGGTCVRIYLPRMANEAASTSKQFRQKPAVVPETILLVEDEEMILSLGKAILERHGYSVLASRDPQEALEMVQSYDSPVDLLITDVVMPNMNGRDLEEKVKRLNPGIKVVFMSGYTSDVIDSCGVIEQNVHFLQKPFSVSSLVMKVREALGAE